MKLLMDYYNTEWKQIIVTATAPLPASFIAKMERFFKSHMPPQFKFELQCTREDQPPNRQRVCVYCISNLYAEPVGVTSRKLRDHNLPITHR